MKTTTKRHLGEFAKSLWLVCVAWFAMTLMLALTPFFILVAATFYAMRRIGKWCEYRVALCNR